jgi:hypothetical protein
MPLSAALKQWRHPSGPSRDFKHTALTKSVNAPGADKPSGNGCNLRAATAGVDVRRSLRIGTAHVAVGGKPQYAMNEIRLPTSRYSRTAGLWCCRSGEAAEAARNRGSRFDQPLFGGWGYKAG